MNNVIENQEQAPFSLDRVRAAIEAILYAAGHPVEYAKISEVLGLGKSDVKSIVEAMAEEYNGEDSPRGVLLLAYPESCQFATKEEFLPYIREALGIKRGGNLSNSTLEALAVVAYNQPVTRAYVDAVRGVDSNYAVVNRRIEECLAVERGCTANVEAVAGVNASESLTCICGKLISGVESYRIDLIACESGSGCSEANVIVAPLL